MNTVATIDDLLRIIGRLQVENELLRKRCGDLESVLGQGEIIPIKPES